MKTGEHYFEVPYLIGAGVAAEFSCRADYEITHDGCPAMFDPVYGNHSPPEAPEVEIRSIWVEVTVDKQSRWAQPNHHIGKLIERFMESKEFYEELMRDVEREIA